MSLISLLLTTFTAIVGGCSSGVTMHDGAMTVGAVNETCPVSGEPISGVAPTVRVGAHTVAFATDADASQFATLKPEVKERLVTSDILRRRGIVNRECPISGKYLPIDAPMMRVDHQRIAFYSMSDIEQLEALPIDRRDEVLAAAVMPARGVVNLQCPISGSVIGMDAVLLPIGSRIVAFNSHADLRQFRSLEADAQAEIVNELILFSRGVTNQWCPVTGERLPGDAPTLEFRSRVIGFASEADLRQFESLNDEARARVLRDTILAARGIANRRCPISGERLGIGAPTDRLDGRVIGFATPADRRQFQSLDSEAREWAIIVTVLESRGIENRRCPVSGERLPGDAPTDRSDGRVIGFASEADRKQWDSLPESQRRRLVD